jgi:hypothetical protein
MKRNIGTADRIIRLAIAILLLVYSWVAGSWIALGLGLFTLYEAVASWCVLYQILGKNSCPIDRK